MSGSALPETTAHPLILTVMLDPASQARFDALRRRLFPPALNHLHAHVTMFHHLPGAHQPKIMDHLTEACRTMSPAPFTVTGLRFLGRGTAYALGMPGVVGLRQSLATVWQSSLTRQDSQPWHPHVTVQNKVAPDEARQVYDALLAEQMPPGGQAIGVELWSYLGGPWHHLGRQLFRSQPLSRCS